MIQETRHAIDEILSRQPLFRGLSGEELQCLASGAREFRVSRNEILFNKGDMPTGIHVVVMGQIKLFLPAQNGWEKVIHMEGPGSSFGEAMVFLDKPYPVSAQATQDSIVLLVAKEAISRTLDDNPALSRKMLASLSMRLHELLTDIEACTLRSSVQRVICYLTQQAPADAHRFVVALDTSKQTVASQLNLAPETFSRVLSHLSGAGLITVEGRRITVLDAGRLRDFTG